MQTFFKRYEIKFLLTQEQYEYLMPIITAKLQLDKYGKSIIQSMYYDTDNFLLIRRSIEKPIYKEKLRLRSYGIVNGDDNVFVELKKKFNGVVFKRRIVMKYDTAKLYLSDRVMSGGNQIKKEIDYFKKQYVALKPKILLQYDRLAYADSNTDLRITFDTSIKYRNYDLELDKGIYGEDILKKGQVLMEVKTTQAIPIWIAEHLSKIKATKTHFSKYAIAYKNCEIMKKENEKWTKSLVQYSQTAR